jgi:hypothetical protein
MMFSLFEQVIGWSGRPVYLPASAQPARALLLTTPSEAPLEIQLLPRTALWMDRRDLLPDLSPAVVLSGDFHPALATWLG